MPMNDCKHVFPTTVAHYPICYGTIYFPSFQTVKFADVNMCLPSNHTNYFVHVCGMCASEKCFDIGQYSLRSMVVHP